jgi:hypothetical protein
MSEGKINCSPLRTEKKLSAVYFHSKYEHSLI